jgi:hypothetical protein
MALMGTYNLVEVNGKKQYIEIWLGGLNVRSSFSFFTLLTPHDSMKSSAKSLCSSLWSTSSSTRATHRGTKHVKRGASASTIDWPLKRARHTPLSQVSSPVPSDEEGTDQATEDQASVKTDKLLYIIRIESDDELDCNVPTGRLSDLDARGCLSGSTTTKYITS